MLAMESYPLTTAYYVRGSATVGSGNNNKLPRKMEPMGERLERLWLAGAIRNRDNYGCEQRRRRG